MIKEAIIKLVNKGDLTYDEAFEVMNEIMDGKTSPTQNAAFLAALTTKNTRTETEAEIAGCASAMRTHALTVEHPHKVLDIVGTGGDGSNTFNISTTSSFVIAAAGTKVAKHGNRAASSQSGAADCLEALGININQPPEKAAKLLDDPGMCFMFAQIYHSSMKYVGSIRKELGFRTVFNILGPLTNPAHPNYQVLGVYDESLVIPLAHVLSNLGVEKGVVVYGQDGFDEFSPAGATTVCEFEGTYCDRYVVMPEDFRLKRCTKADLVGGTPEDNARITLDILKGVKGPRYDAVLLNSAAGLYASRKASSLRDGIELADQIISDGKAYEQYEKFKAASNQ
ncbi:MAG: anthranilate phosphoribosyltransferase [Candidatus Methanomethylophilaceae archaeon]|nr:anthranilate phosphoribosyltransferase [Candidatus Methanomethylophilaceae archaeon]